MNEKPLYYFPENLRILGLSGGRLLIISLLMIFFAFPDTGCIAQPTPKKILLALSKTDHTLAIVDPVSLKVITRIPVGVDPHEVIASEDGKTAYVSIYGGGSLHEIDIIDLVNRKPLANFDTRPLMGPHGLTFVDGKLWYTAEGSKAVGRYDPAAHKTDWCMGTGQDRTHMIYVTPDGKKVYTTNVASGTVSILTDSLFQPGPNPMGGPPPGARAHRDWVQTVVPVSKGAEGFDVTPDGRELWTVTSQNGSIYIINTASAMVTDKIDADIQGANRLEITPDGKQVLISSLRTGDIFIYSTATHKELKRINTGHGAAGILIDDNGSRAFVGCTADNYVAIIDLKTMEVAGHIDVGGGPDGLAWAVRP